MEVKSKTFF